MRFKIILEVNKAAFGNKLPINYQYEQSAAIYKILSSADKEYSEWLHDNGFKLESGKTFKLFNFSRFKIEKRRILRDEHRIQIFSDTIEWQISFLPEKSTQDFIQGLFQNQIFEIGDRISKVQFIIKSVEVMPAPEFNGIATFRTMSPLCLKFKRIDGKIDYLSPLDVRAKTIFFKGLFDRFLSFYGRPSDYPISECDLEVLDEPKSVKTTIKAFTKEQTDVRGFMCTLRIKAPDELLHLMYESGAGSLCSQGFGCLYVKSDK